MCDPVTVFELQQKIVFVSRSMYNAQFHNVIYLLWQLGEAFQGGDAQQENIIDSVALRLDRDQFGDNRFR